MTYQRFLPGVESCLQRMLRGQEVIQPHQMLGVLSDHTHQLLLGLLHSTLEDNCQINLCRGVLKC